MKIDPQQTSAAAIPRLVAARTPLPAAPLPAAPVATEMQPTAPVDTKAVKDAAKAANDAAKAIGSEISFAVDEDTGKTVVRVVDKQSGTLIRQIPSQEMLEIAQALDRLQGLLIRNSA